MCFLNLYYMYMSYAELSVLLCVLFYRIVDTLAICFKSSFLLLDSKVFYLFLFLTCVNHIPGKNQEIAEV